MYVPKNILITGGAGFIGSHVANHLCNSYPDYNIIVFDKQDYCSISLSKLNPNIVFIKGDIQTSDLVLHILKEYNIDTVMHFAAHTHVDNSFGNSIQFTINNSLGTHSFLESCRVYNKVQRFIYVSTDEVYGESSLGKDIGLKEDSIMEPTNPYAAAKASAEMMCKAYINSYNMPIIVTRGNNVYGPLQYPEKLIPKMILLAKHNKHLPIHGDGNSKRSYLYIDDVVNAFDKILHFGTINETYNIGSDEEMSVNQVVNDILFHMDKKDKCKVHNVTDRLFNDRRYYISSSKLKSLGWIRKTSWEEGLKNTIDWYKNLDNYDSLWKSNINELLELESQ